MSKTTHEHKVLTLMQTVASVFDYTTAMNLIANTRSSVDELTPAAISSGLCLFCSETAPAELFVPSKDSRVISWLNGTVVNPDDVHRIFSKRPTDQDSLPDVLPGKLVLRLNSDQHVPQEFPNYANRVKRRLTDFMQGRWSSMSVYSGGVRSTVILAKKNQEMYFSLVYLDQCSLLFWGTQLDFLVRLLDALPSDIEQSFLKHECFVTHITPLSAKNTLVLQPIYLLTKYRTWSERANFNHMRVFTVVSSYLERLAL